MGLYGDQFKEKVAIVTGAPRYADSSPAYTLGVPPVVSSRTSACARCLVFSNWLVVFPDPEGGRQVRPRARL